MDLLVSVIIPAYNAEKHIVEAISSIKNQTYKNLEIIIINDGSTDSTDILIKDLIKEDPRCLYISRENKGLVETLNEMLSLATGYLIARMDADDISLPNRIEKQVEFLKNNKNVALLGSRVEWIDQEGRSLGYCKRPISQEDIQAYFLYGSPLAHPSVMFNLFAIPKEELIYSIDAFPVEDLELWLRINNRYEIRNISDALIKYRINSNGISHLNQEKQKKKGVEARLNHCSNDKYLVKLINTIDGSFDSLIIKAFKTLFATLVLMVFNSKYKARALLKLWLKTVVRDLRSL